MPPNRITFRTDMVRAIRAGTKTQTRRDNWKRWDGLKPGHLLWVGESFAFLPDGSVIYAADLPDPPKPDHARTKPGVTRWRPGFSMPMLKSRLTLKVTSARIEKLQAITQEDAKAEGVETIAHYRLLWNEINGNLAWERNPLVAVICFEVA